jgi:multidrug transporter EmrE-like cation transporter
MTPMDFLLLAGAAAINAGASALLKYSSIYRGAAGAKPGLAAALFVLAMALYGGCFPLYAVALSRTRLSVAQPTFAAVTFVATAALAILVFKEGYTALRIGGLALIVAGIFMVARG